MMEKGTEVKTNDGKVGKIECIYELGTLRQIMLVNGEEYLASQLTPIRPEEKREWFWTIPAIELQTKEEAIEDARKSCARGDKPRLFYWPDGEKVE